MSPIRVHSEKNCTKSTTNFLTKGLRLRCRILLVTSQTVKDPMFWSENECCEISETNINSENCAIFSRYVW